MSLVIFVVRHGYVTVLCVIYYIGHCVTRAMCCLDLVWKNLNFIHQTYSRLVKCFSHILCTIGGTSFVCGNLNHAAKTAVENGTLGNPKNSFFIFWFVLVTISSEYNFVRIVSMAPFCFVCFVLLWFVLFWWSTFHMFLIVFLAGFTVLWQLLWRII